MFWSEHEAITPAVLPISSTTISIERLRSATDIEKNSLCLPAMNTPSMPRSSTQCRRFCRKPFSSIDEILGERHQGCGPDAFHVGAGVVLGVRTAVFHG